MREQKSQRHRDFHGHARLAHGEGLIHCREMLSLILPQTSRSNYLRKGILLTKDLTGKILESRASNSSTKGIFCQVNYCTCFCIIVLIQFSFHALKASLNHISESLNVEYFYPEAYAALEGGGDLGRSPRKFLSNHTL